MKALNEKQRYSLGAFRIGQSIHLGIGVYSICRTKCYRLTIPFGFGLDKMISENKSEERKCSSQFELNKRAINVSLIDCTNLKVEGDM